MDIYWYLRFYSTVTPRISAVQLNTIGFMGPRKTRGGNRNCNKHPSRRVKNAYCINTGALGRGRNEGRMTFWIWTMQILIVYACVHCSGSRLNNRIEREENLQCRRFADWFYAESTTRLISSSRRPRAGR